MGTADGVLPLGRPIRRRKAFPLILAVALAFALAIWLLHDRVVHYRVNSASMQPTLPIGSRVAVEPGLTFRLGYIVAFHPPAGAVSAAPTCGAAGQGEGFSQPCGIATPESSNLTFIKRIVAGPGDLVSIRAGRAVVNGVTSAEPFAASCDSAPNCNFPTPVRVPPDQYYVLGDNRGTSDDSRFWGPIPTSSIVGVVVTCQPLQTACQPRR